MIDLCVITSKCEGLFCNLAFTFEWGPKDDDVNITISVRKKIMAFLASVGSIFCIHYPLTPVPEDRNRRGVILFYSIFFWERRNTDYMWRSIFQEENENLPNSPLYAFVTWISSLRPAVSTTWSGIILDWRISIHTYHKCCLFSSLIPQTINAGADISLTQMISVAQQCCASINNTRICPQRRGKNYKKWIVESLNLKIHTWF